jgi:hypothetical protein
MSNFSQSLQNTQNLSVVKASGAMCPAFSGVIVDWREPGGGV